MIYLGSTPLGLGRRRENDIRVRKRGRVSARVRTWSQSGRCGAPKRSEAPVLNWRERSEPVEAEPSAPSRLSLGRRPSVGGGRFVVCSLCPRAPFDDEFSNSTHFA